MDKATALNVLGFLGVVANYVVALAPYRAVMAARKSGTLGGLDIRTWPIQLMCNLMWSCYAIFLADLWLFVCSMGPAAMWLFFNITAISLLFKEAGQHESPTSTAWSADKPALRRADAVSDLDSVCSTYRHQSIRQIELSATMSVVTTTCISLICAPGTFTTFLNAEAKQQIFSIATIVVTFCAWMKPAQQIKAVVQRRDATTIFLPLSLAQCLYCADVLWYGLLSENFALLVANSVGLTMGLLQVMLKCVFARRRTDEVAADPDSGDTGVTIEACAIGAPTSQEAEAEDSVPTSPMSMSPKALWHSVRSSFASSQEQGSYEDYLEWQRNNLRKTSRNSSRDSETDLISAMPKLALEVKDIC